jgi:hypothetical protein
MGRPRNRAYKRTWKNLLINKRYQLRFTLFMVGLSSVLMGLLGWWVMSEAGNATTTAIDNRMTACRDLPGAPAPAGAAPAGAAAKSPPPHTSPPAAEPPAPAQPAGGRRRGGKTPRPRPRPVVTIDDSGMPAEPPASAPSEPAGPTGQEVAAYRRCEAAVPAAVRSLEHRLRLTFWTLLASGALIALALLLYGIKMTHRVAGPLYKVSLYMSKLRDGHYDVVYNLRKGDHLREFYEHFKAAHAGMRAVQEEDVARLRALLAAADEARLAERSTALAEAVSEMRTMLDEKEKSLA